jgi:hypothetical protein
MNARKIPGFTAELSFHGKSGPKYAGRGQSITERASQELIVPQFIHGCRCNGTLHCYPPPIRYCFYGPPYKCYCW